MNQFDFKLETGDRNSGTVYLPETVDHKLPVVIYCHGWGVNRKLGPSVHSLCAALTEASAALVAFDFWGCGETGGSYRQMSYGRWTANLKDVFDWVALQAWADPHKIGCFGISSGTRPALRLAEECPATAFVVSVATCLGLFIGMPHGPGQILVENWDTLIGGGTAEVFGIPFGLDFFKDFIGGAPVYDLKRIACPVFFLQGAADNPWRRSDAWTGYQVMKKNGLAAKYLEIEAGDHGLDNLPERCAQEVMAWLREIGILRER